jgi:hypothetical protein
MVRKVFVAACCAIMAVSVLALDLRKNNNSTPGSISQRPSLPLNKASDTMKVADGSSLFVTTASNNALQQQPVPAQAAEKEPKGEMAQNVPDHVLYEHLFYSLILLKAKADEKEKMGQNAEALKTYYKRLASLSDQQEQDLDLIARECYRDVKAMDSKAKQFIDEARALHPGGRLAPGEELPPLPQELSVMQKERDAIILRAMDRLRIALGKQAFARIDAAVHKHITANLKPLAREGEPPKGPVPQRPFVQK